VQAVTARHPSLSRVLVRRLARAYGSRIDRVLGVDGTALGAEVAPGLHEGELHYLHHHEWACTADDVLWRRTKLGLHLEAADRARVQAWCDDHWGAGAAPTGAPTSPAADLAEARR
jgi:glycerol-3-phosphate dehydrogenase